MKRKIFALTFFCVCFSIKAQYTREPRVYGEYIEPYDMDLLKGALSYKQRAHNYNLSILYKYVEQFYATVKYKANQNGGLTTSQADFVNKMMESIKYLPNADWSNRQETDQTIDLLKEIINIVNEW